MSDSYTVAPRDRHPALHVVWKPSANYPDDCRRSECVVSFCSQDRLALVVRRWRKFSLGLSLLNREVAERQIQTPESISNTFERSGPQLRLICDRNQTVRCPCFDGMVIPWLAAIALVWDFLISRAGWLSLPHLPDAAKEPGRSRASNPDPDQRKTNTPPAITCKTSQCSAKRPFAILTISAATQATGRPIPENHPCMVT